MTRPPRASTLFPYTTLFRSAGARLARAQKNRALLDAVLDVSGPQELSAYVRDDADVGRSEEHTSELQSLRHLVCRLLLEKKKNKIPHRKLPSKPSTQNPKTK